MIKRLLVIVFYVVHLHADPNVRLSVPLPERVTNNAVAYISLGGVEYLVSFSGVGGSRTQSNIHAKTWVYRFDNASWELVGVVPEGEGRLASVAVTVAEKIYVFGGYTVAPDGVEVSLPYVHTFDPRTNKFSALKSMPVAVDDTVALVYLNRYVYLVSGWHEVGNVNLVQRYDIITDSWTQATRFPGPPVFGHAGAIVGAQLLICGGSKITIHPDKPRDFVLSEACYRGTIDTRDSRRIQWRLVDDPYGASRYRAVAAADARGVLFAGGTNRPYNYNGIGYDGVPAEPLPELLKFNFESSSWQRRGNLEQPSMDHRGLLVRNDEFWLLGGMLDHQRVTGNVTVFTPQD